MFLKKIVPLGMVIFLSCMVNCFAADSASDYLDRNNAVAIKLGAHVFEGSTFTDAWDIGVSDFTGFACEVSYERKITDGWSVELPLGISYSSDISSSSLFTNDWSETSFQSIYLAPSAKYYVPLTQKLFGFAGAGLDLAYSTADYDYRVDGDHTYDASETYWTPGAHLLAGIKWYISTKQDTFEGSWDIPASLNLEYRYTWESISNADKDQIRIVNETFGTDFPAHDLDIGGHLITLGLQYHW